MRRLIISVTFILICGFSVGQRVATQRFKVRKITYSTAEQVVPIAGVFVEINKVKFRSDGNGEFVANIPISGDSGFNISNVVAPGYILSIPQDLNTRLYLTSNPIDIVLANVDAVRRERERIAATNQSTIDKCEKRIEEEVARNQALLRTLETQKEKYAQTATELEKLRNQLQAIQYNKVKWINKADSLASTLALVDVQSLIATEQKRIELEKSGQWMEVLMSEVFDKLDKHLSAKMENMVVKFEKQLEQTADVYAKQYINNGSSNIVNFFAYRYEEYLNTKINILDQQENYGLDLVTLKAIEDRLYRLKSNHVSHYKELWLKNVGQVEAPKYQYQPKSREESEREFMQWAMYPQREELYRTVKGVYRREMDYKELTVVFDRVHPEFMKACRTVATKFEEEYSVFSDDKILSLNDEEWYHLSSNIEEAIRVESFYRESSIFWGFKNVMMQIVASAMINRLIIRNNNLIKAQEEAVMSAKLEPLHVKLKPIDQENRFSNLLQWENRKYEVQEHARLEELRSKYPDYVAFLYPIVMRFMQPIIDKYNSDEAAYVYLSCMQDDVYQFCYSLFRKYGTKLENIAGLRGSDKNMCVSIVRAIIEVEESKIIMAHNNRCQTMLEAKSAKENKIVESLRMTKFSFEKESDVVAFFATHKFINDDYSISRWYNSAISEWHSNLGYYDITGYSIVEWSSNSAKVKIMMGDFTMIVTVVLNADGTATYSESVPGQTIDFKAVKK